MQINMAEMEQRLAAANAAAKAEPIYKVRRADIEREAEKVHNDDRYLLRDGENDWCGFKYSELVGAMNAVANKVIWKYPIKAHIEPDLIDLVAAAISYMAGGGAQFRQLANGWVKVTAPGYYNMIGA